MKIYTVYMKKDAESPEETAEFVPEGFLWWAFVPLLNLFWPLQRKCWLYFALILLTYYVFEVFARGSDLFSASLFVEGMSWKFYMAFRLIILIFLGAHGNDFWRKKLEHSGYEIVDIVSASDEIEAQRRFFDRRFSTA